LRFFGGAGLSGGRGQEREADYTRLKMSGKYSYVTGLVTTESLGWWRISGAFRRIYFAQMPSQG
jgi:hypothetical protein